MMGLGDHPYVLGRAERRVGLSTLSTPKQKDLKSAHEHSSSSKSLTRGL